MKVTDLYFQRNKLSLKQETNEIFIGFSGVEEDFRAKSFSGQIPVKISKSNADKFDFAGENIVFQCDKGENPELLDLISNGNICLEICLDTRNAKVDDEIGFSNGIRCSLPKNGYFIRTIKKGKISKGDEFQLIKKVFTAQVITLSDRASQGIYDDLSGNQIQNMLEEYFATWQRKLSVSRAIIPDEAEILKSTFMQAVENKTDIIITTGGTGIGSRDICPETLRPLIHKEIPGIMEMIRIKYGTHIPTALISRTFAGTYYQSLIYALPGSKKAVTEYMNEILPTLDHSLLMIRDVKAH